MSPLTYTLDEAAQRLGGGFTRDWLKNHLDEIPHIRHGHGRGRNGRISFSEAQLAQIVALFSVEPAPQSQPGDFTPVTRRRRSA